jgi:putative phage-type endonuclease
MKILNLTQNTTEWEDFRQSHIGASDIGILMDGSEKEIYDLMQYKRGTKDRFVNHAMQRGTEMECEAIDFFLGRPREDDEKATALADDPNSWLMASFDFIDQDKRYVVEIKCPLTVLDTPQEHSKFKRWEWQVQAQLAVSGYEYGFIYVYSPVKTTVCKILRDEDMINRLKEKGVWFYQLLVNFEDPPAPAEVPERADEMALDWAMAFKAVDSQIKELEEQRSILRDEGIAIAGEEPFSCAGVKVVRVENKITIDYESACKANNIDASIFKKIPKTPYTWRVGPCQKK